MRWSGVTTLEPPEHHGEAHRPRTGTNGTRQFAAPNRRARERTLAGRCAALSALVAVRKVNTGCILAPPMQASRGGAARAPLPFHDCNFVLQNWGSHVVPPLSAAHARWNEILARLAVSGASERVSKFVQNLLLWLKICASKFARKKTKSLATPINQRA